MIIKFTLNNEKVSINVDPGATLSEVLRNEFKLYSVNECCTSGNCGGCTVLKDKLPVPACMVKMYSVKNSNILTFEHIMTTKEFDVIKKVFDACECKFCDFCRHGKFMTIYALLKSNSALSEKDIYEALSGNTCSCTDFTSLCTAIKLASNALKRGKRAERK